MLLCMALACAILGLFDVMMDESESQEDRMRRRTNNPHTIKEFREKVHRTPSY